MKTKLVTRYYCDFCRKATCSASHTSRHERACTANPNRVCRMCTHAGLYQKPLDELQSAWLKDIERDSVGKNDPYGTIYVTPTELAEAADHCPACILAAMRQHRDDSIRSHWSWKDAVAEFWTNINDETEEREAYSAAHAGYGH